MQKDSHPQEKRNPAAQGNEEAKPHGPVRVIVEIPPTERDKKTARRQQKDRRDRIRRAIEITTLIVLGIYTSINYMLYVASDTNNRQSLSMFKATQRARIVPGRPDGAIVKFEQWGSQQVVTVFLQNSGKIPLWM